MNRAVGHAFAHSVGRQIVIPRNPELLGALGVALLALQRGGEGSGAVSAAPQNLLALTVPELKLVGRFTCGACNMACSIDRFEVAGRRFPFGGRCSLFENVWKRRSRTAPAPDLVEQRARMLFGSATLSSPRVERAVLSAPSSAMPTQQRAEDGAPYRSRSTANSVAPVPQSAHPALSPLQNAMLKVQRFLPTLPPSPLATRHSPLAPQPSIGIPRALTTHSLFPLYSTFFAGLGLEVVLSDVDARGELKSYSGFCFPAQIAHGALLDLSGRSVGLVFLPHIVRMPQDNPCRDSYLCPVTQAGPYFLAKAFPDLHFLSPLLDFTRGYEASSALVELAVRDLGKPRDLAVQAWAAAVRAQTEVERALCKMGQDALAQAVKAGKPAILLAGRSYNAFTPEASQSVGKKLSSMGVTVIPADCLAPVGEGPTVWYAANQILNAVALARQHPNLFLLCVSNFSCTIDAFTHAMLAAEMGAKPYLILEIDAHTADAGVQTRLEAFLDIVANYRETQASLRQPFTPCRLASGGQVIRADGERVPLTDARVKIYFPNFSQYHAQAFAMAARWLGLHPGVMLPLDRRQLERGLQYTSGRECLPLPICIGQLLHISEHHQPGELAGFYMIRGGAPCVSDSYMGYFERFIDEQRLADVFLLNPDADNNYLGFDTAKLGQHLSPTIVLADILVEIEHVLRVVGAPGSLEKLREEWQRFADATESLGQFQADVPEFVERLASLPRTRSPLNCPRVVVTGDFFTRFSPFFMEGVAELYAERGIILKPVDLSDLLLYGAYHGVAEAAGSWGMKPGGLALARACTRIFQPDGKDHLRKWAGYHAERWYEQHFRGLFLKTGLLVAGANDASLLFEKATEHVSAALYGETIPTIGKGLEAHREGYDGIIVIGPFNCLPYRISEAILRPLSLQRGMPILTYESDGYGVAPSFLRQVDVHIQQVLEHAASTPA